jgi:hypothetical protein
MKEIKRKKSLRYKKVKNGMRKRNVLLWMTGLVSAVIG